jgi:phospholipid/cholesterol/gamma-HCH transport system ATP-binding protein
MSFGDRTVFDDLSCRFPRGKITAILGGSGSGKSTLLRLVGGLVHPECGAVEVAGVDITRLPERRMFEVRDKLGMLFQGGALLDSLDILENLSLPLREHTSMQPNEIREEVRSQLEAVGLAGVEPLLPGQLSGGMLRRAALARAIIRRPEILLCDEPFSGLDPASQKRIELLLTRLNHQRGMTLMVVSHHIASTLRFADHAILLLPGRAVSGTPQELKGSADPEVADFFNEDLELSEGSPARAASWTC